MNARRLFLAIAVTGIAILIGSLAWSPAPAPQGTSDEPAATGSLPVIGNDPSTPPHARRGEVVATIRIPALGEDWRHEIVDGISADDLARGVGHYPMTPPLGAQGNVALAAHRWQGPFYDFERLRPGVTIIVTTAAARFTYRVTTDVQRVLPSDTWVIDPIPGAQREHVLTLTTCWPKNGSSHREFVRARLIERSTR